MSVTAEALRLQARLDAMVESITDGHTRTLVAAWALAWSEVSADLQDTLLELIGDGGQISRSTVLRSLRLREVLRRIADALTNLAADAGVTITSDLAEVVDAAAKAQRDILGAELPNTNAASALLNQAWSSTDDDALAVIVARTTEQITSLTEPLSDASYDAVRRELIRGIAAGDNPRATARRMLQRSERRFNGGLNRAMTISRTEMLSAYRQAAKMGQDRHTDVLLGWVWLADLSVRTCPACLAKHGEEFPPQIPGPDGHQNCRCSRTPRSKSWADLGFEGMDEPADEIEDAETWFNTLPGSDQIAIMGAARLKLLRDGSINWADLAQLRHTAGWRDSWNMTSLKRLQALARGRVA